MKQVKLTDTYHALLAMLATRPMEDVSITALCRKAHVSRTYFYREFGTFDAIIKKFQTQQMLQYLRSLPNSGRPNLATLMAKYFQLAKNGVENQQLLLKAGFYTTLVDTFATVFTLLIKNSLVPGKPAIVSAPYYIDFLSGAVVNMAVAWMAAGMPDSPERMGERVAKFLQR
ncbi:TetR/AcrR family transcriptional regulator [Furfurilactobacillus siliginis]|uniref:Transcription regulator n=2 Tax=Furfurilactobacillus siliginis TaxID=348151 RepID=A0A0R2L9G8_9LACO|nr:TetR/AcrR family transcriptional regulator [Furfurilactobacillus siliginis]KRN95108.1 transcription regulator [Furfurilactobacillus siliginis]